jgi:uncharacterized repeat protein (TIGR01451 family)
MIGKSLNVQKNHFQGIFLLYFFSVVSFLVSSQTYTQSFSKSGKLKGNQSAGNLTYSKTSCPDDGSYRVQSSSSDCFNGAWRSPVYDHTTGDGTGYLFIVNASNTPGQVFFKDIIESGLCASTTYQFSVWLFNPHMRTTSVLPNVTIKFYKADGTTLISTFNPGDIPMSATNSAWTQYMTTFVMPAGETGLVYTFTMNSSGGNGSDLFIDDIQFAPIVTTITASSVSSVCAGTSFTLTGSITAGGYSSTVYQWQRSTNNGSSWSNISGATALTYTTSESTAGSYQYRLLSAAETNNLNTSCGITSNAVTVTVNACSDLSVTKVVDNSKPSVGDQVTFTITATNSGPSDATAVKVTDILPAGFSYVSYTSSSGTYSSTTGTWAISSLTSGSTATIKIVATVK